MEEAFGSPIFGAEQTLEDDKHHHIKIALGAHPKEGIFLCFDQATSCLRFSPEEAVDFGKTLLGHGSMLNQHHRIHRKAPKVPLNPDKRRLFIKWVLEHPLWSHPFTYKAPPNCVNVEEIMLCDMLEPGPDWVVIETVNGSYLDCIHFECVFVDPTTESISPDPKRNTAFRIRIEAGGWVDLSLDEDIPPPPEGWNSHNRWEPYIDENLSCSGEDMESALINLGLQLKFFFNDDGSPKMSPEYCGGDFIGDPNNPDNFAPDCVDAGDGFCLICGYAMEPSRPQEKTNG